jgi:predicted lipoprotein with Yx(FWY)xxD motif
MRRRSAATALATVAVAAAVAVAGCGGSNSPNDSAASSGGGYGAGASSSTTSTPATSSGAATVKTASGDLGTFLVDGKGRTLYLWEADKGSKSTCNGACAEAWPPLTTTGDPKVAGDADSSMLGTTKRDDGTTEVTYAGHPLYFYAGDQKPGDTAGQGSDGFGAEWYVLDAKGSAIEDD